jgi:hypothetical protein
MKRERMAIPYQAMAVSQSASVSLSTRGNTQAHTKAESTIDPLCTETDEGGRNGRIGHHLGEALIDRPHDAAPEEECNEESRRTALGQGGPHLHVESFMFRPCQSRSLNLAYVLSGKTYTCQLLLCHVSGVHVKPRAARKAPDREGNTYHQWQRVGLPCHADFDATTALPKACQ